MKTLNDLITTKQQEAQKQADRIWNAGITLTHNDLDEILNALVSDTAHSVLDAVKLETDKLKNVRNGWSKTDSGECCAECSMEKYQERAAALKVIVSCKDPFQMRCACHIQPRINSVLSRLERFSSNEE